MTPPPKSTRRWVLNVTKSLFDRRGVCFNFSRKPVTCIYISYEKINHKDCYHAQNIVRARDDVSVMVRCYDILLYVSTILFALQACACTPSATGSRYVYFLFIKQTEYSHVCLLNHFFPRLLSWRNIPQKTHNVILIVLFQNSTSFSLKNGFIRFCFYIKTGRGPVYR